MERGYGKVLTIVLIVLIIAIIGILGFFAFRIYNSSSTTKKSSKAVSEFDENTPTIEKNNNNNNNNEEDGDGPSLEDIINNFGDENSSIYNTDNSGKKDTYYKGFKVIGTISIPTINVEYPILEEHSTNSLKVAIVAVYPKKPESAVNQPGHLILWGHNYKDNTFFSNLSKLKTGDKIYIKDTSGTKLTYQVYNLYETTDSDSEYSRRNTEGKREITLATCSGDKARRTVVWAREVE